MVSCAAAAGRLNSRANKARIDFKAVARYEVMMAPKIAEIGAQKDSPCNRSAKRNVPAGAAKSCKPDAVNAQNVVVEWLPNNFGQVGQDQNQCGGEQNKSRLTYFRMFEHG